MSEEETSEEGNGEGNTKEGDAERRGNNVVMRESGKGEYSK